MKFQGKIVKWNDDKGFGFVEPNGGGERAFVHIKAFMPRSRRPIDGEVIVYELAMDDNKRYKAEKIKFAQDDKKNHSVHKSKNSASSSSNSRSNIRSTFTFIFFAGLITCILTGRLPPITIGVYLTMSCVAFIAYAIDKSAAQNGRWRTQESTLHLFSLTCGWPGALFAQRRLRHKSKKKEFQRVFWVTVILNIAGLFWLLTDNGSQFINDILGWL